ncbi:MAG: heavy-metal-associated domain-containing protein [Planctomycetota bacterium]
MSKIYLIPLACLALSVGLLGCSTTGVVDSGSTASNPNANVAIITAAGMSCPLCAGNIDRQLKRIDGFQAMQMNLETGELFVSFDATAIQPTSERLTQAIADAGFTVDAVRWQDGTEAEAEALR